MAWDAYKSKQETAEAFDDPCAGDMFHEMFSHWVLVLHRDGDRIAWMTAGGGQTIHDDGKTTVGTVAQFKQKYAYGSIPGYWVMLSRRGYRVPTEWVPLEMFYPMETAFSLSELELMARQGG